MPAPAARSRAAVSSSCSLFCSSLVNTVVSRGAGTLFTAGYVPVVAGRDGAPAGSPPIAVGTCSPVLDDAQPARSIRPASSRSAQSTKGASDIPLERVLLKSDAPANDSPKPEVIQLIGCCWRQYDQSEVNSPLRHLRVHSPPSVQSRPYKAQDAPCGRSE